MKHIYAFETMKEYEKYQDVIIRLSKKLSTYCEILEAEYELKAIPKGVVWTTEELATTVFSNVPIPAYTNENLIYMTPDLSTWRNLFIKQLDGKIYPNIKNFYQHYSENQLFIILAHELTHHSDLFLDEFDNESDESIWFEEGMCFYLPRRLLLSKEEFEEITDVETKLIEIFKHEYGNRPLDEFGSSSYQGSLSSIMFDYWRSFLAVKHLVENRANNNVCLVLDMYHKWDKEGRKVTLTDYFQTNL